MIGFSDFFIVTITQTCFVKMGFTREKRLETSYPVVNLDIDTLVTRAAELSCSDDDQGLTSFKNQDSRQEKKY